MKRVLLVCLALILFLAVSCAPEAEQPPSNNEQEEKPPVDSGNETEEPKEETNSSNISGIVGESGAYTIPESIFKVEKTLSYALENIDKGVKSGSSLSFTNLKVAEGVILNGTIETSSTRALEEKNVEIIQKKIRLMINGLANAGLASSQANNDDLRSILDNFLNGGQKTEFGTVLA